jgi:hypothetical protein
MTSTYAAKGVNKLDLIITENLKKVHRVIDVVAGALTRVPCVNLALRTLVGEAIRPEGLAGLGVHIIRYARKA